MDDMLNETPARKRIPKPRSYRVARAQECGERLAVRVGRDANRIAEELIAQLTGLVGDDVRVTLEIEAELEKGAPDHVVRTITENSRTLKFTS